MRIVCALAAKRDSSFFARGKKQLTVCKFPHIIIITEGGYMRFLLVEDSRTTRNLIKSYVKEMDLGRPASFLEAENGEVAMEMLKSNHVDFVFLDWNLSSLMTGLDVLLEIRKQEKHKQLPVIMVTSEADKPNVIKAMKCGANDYAVKPIDKRVLTEKVMKIVMNAMH